jgi:hypothetical protein
VRRLICLLVLSPLLAGAAVTREEGAIYLEDFLPKPVKLAVLADAPAFYNSDMQRYLGTLRKGQQVELQAVSDAACRVRGMAQQGQVAGWVEPKFLTPLDKQFVANLHKNAERAKQVRELIQKNEVAINMTPDEVQKSLGKAQKKSSHLDAAGRQDVWEYIRYENVPKEVTGADQFGRLVTTVVYVKVPVGRLAVTFENNLVNAIEQSEGTLEKGGNPRIIIPPLEVKIEPGK